MSADAGAAPLPKPASGHIRLTSHVAGTRGSAHPMGGGHRGRAWAGDRHHHQVAPTAT